MSADLTSRGVKRKLEDEGDGLEEEGSRRNPAAKLVEQSSLSQPPVPLTVSPPNSNSNSNGSSNLQRQHIFNSSLCKLSRSRQSSDPSLLRSVLICNTLRMLEKELEGAGYKINFGPNGVSFISPVPPTQAELELMPPTFQSVPPPPPPSTPPPPPCSPFVDSSIAFSPAPVPTGAAGCESAAAAQLYPGTPPLTAPTVLGDSSMSSYADDGNSSGDGSFDYDKYFSQLNGTTLPSGRATPFLRNYTAAGAEGEEQEMAVPPPPMQYSPCDSPPADSPAVTLTSGTAADNPLMSITCTTAPTASSSPPTTQSTNSLSSSPSSLSSSSSTFSLLSSSSSSSLSSSSSSYLVPSYVSFTTGSDEIFGDIDLSLYDFDIFSPLSPPSNTSKTTIPLMSAEELMREVNGISLGASLGNSANNSYSSSSASLSSSSTSFSSSSSSSSSSSLLSNGHDPNSVAFSGQISFITSSYCASSSPSSLMSNVIPSLGSSSAASSASSSSSLSSPSSSSSCPSSSAPCPALGATTQPTAQPANCASSASAASAATGAPAPLHLHSASAR